jgi:DNA-binding transcriptional ArsR family regulator
MVHFTEDTTSQDQIKKAKQILRALDHRLRRHIIGSINDNGNRITVTEIYSSLRLEQSVASQHLAILRKAGIVKTERDGKFIYYSVNNDLIKEVVDKCTELIEIAKKGKG